ncbi:MAG TPA: biotin/lipoyl-containing protein [Vicinamibacterales bacterium]|nr:biotin/lipoyl-containing protein [Vicinamibacterales bacterium]
MKFQFDIAERRRTIDVQRQAQGYRVVVDGRPRLVDAVRVGEQAWSLIVRDANGEVTSVEATIVPQNGNGAVDVYLDGHSITVGQRSGLGRRSRASAGAEGAGPQRITAPMPGKVVRVLVSAGDEVQPRQGLVVVEAMKMENELRAARAGRVKQVLVQEGQSVEAGTALVVVE